MIKQRNVVLNILLTEGKTFVAFLIEAKQGTVRGKTGDGSLF